MYASVVEAVLQKYGINYQRILPVQKGYRNEIWPIVLHDGRLLNLTFFKREAGILDRIHRTDVVSEYLHNKGLPTRYRVNAQLLKLQNTHGITYTALYNYLPGNTIPWEAYTMKHLKLLGMAMGRIHYWLANLSGTQLPYVYDEYEAILDRMEMYFLMPSIQAAMEQKLGITLDVTLIKKYKNTLQSVKNLPGRQVLHMDFVRGNILFDTAKPSDVLQLSGIAISGILDFEKAAFGHPIMDIARTLAFLLVDCKYQDAQKIQKYFLHSGYQKRGMVNDIGDTFLRHTLVELFLWYDLYKFLRHTPYESLRENEHYIRTRDILIRRNVVRLVV